MRTHPSLGFGLGLRVEHYAEILGGDPAVDWFEALTENYLIPGGKPLHNLMHVRARLWDAASSTPRKCWAPIRPWTGSRHSPRTTSSRAASRCTTSCTCANGF